MVHQTSNRQAVMNNLKLIILDNLGCKEFWDFGLTQKFL